MYFAALVSRLANTWVSRTASPVTTIDSVGTSTVNSCRAASTAGRLVSTAERTMDARSSGSLCNSITPRVMREISSRSSTSRTRWLIWRCMTAVTLAAVGSLIPASLSSSQSGQQRGKRIAQLVTKCRKEFILALVGDAKGLFGARPVRQVPADLILALA